MARRPVKACVQKYRAGLRGPGLRPVQIWAPDTPCGLILPRSGTASRGGSPRMTGRTRSCRISLRTLWPTPMAGTHELRREQGLRLDIFSPSTTH